MGKFKFKYETVKSVKEAMEKKVQKELSEIDLKIRKILEEIQKLEIRKHNEKREFDNKRKVTVAEIQFFEKYLETLELEKEKLLLEVTKLKEQRSEKQKELMQKAQEVKIMEKLKEKHLEEFIGNENRLEQKQIDEIAKELFVRNKEE